MKRHALPALKSVTEAVYQSEYQKLRPVLEAEARVQNQLARLDAQVVQTRQDSAVTDGYQITGTDVLWNGWEAATRRQLNMELARCRAQKLAALQQLRQAFGRKQAVERLNDTLKAEQKRARSRHRP